MTRSRSSPDITDAHDQKDKKKKNEKQKESMWPMALNKEVLVTTIHAVERTSFSINSYSKNMMRHIVLRYHLLKKGRQVFSYGFSLLHLNIYPMWHT